MDSNMSEFPNFDIPVIEDKVPDYLEFDEPSKHDRPSSYIEFENPTLTSLHKSENVLKLADPPEHDNFISIKPDTHNQNTTEIDHIEELTEELLKLNEPPCMDSLRDSISTADMSKAFETVEKQQSKKNLFFDEEILLLKDVIDKDKDLSTDIYNEHIKSEEIQLEFQNFVFQEMHSDNNDFGLDSKAELDENDLSGKLKSGDGSHECNKLPSKTSDFTENETVIVKPYDGEKNSESKIPIESTEKTNEISNNNVHRNFCGKFKDLISWNHPLFSALIFSVMIFLELGMMLEYSIVSLLAYFSLILLAINFGFRVAVNFDLVNNETTINCAGGINREDVELCVDIVFNWVNYIYNEIKSIAYVESLSKNLKVFAILWLLTYIGQIFNFQSLIFSGTLLLFSVPLVYKKFQVEIDGLVGNVFGQITEMTSATRRLLGCK